MTPFPQGAVVDGKRVIAYGPDVPARGAVWRYLEDGHPYLISLATGEILPRTIAIPAGTEGEKSMQIAVTITLDDGDGFALAGRKLAVIAQEMSQLAGATATAQNVGGTDAAPATEPKKRGRPPKVAAPADDGLGGDDAGDDGLGGATEAADPEITASQVLSAFQAFAQKNGRDKAKAILERMGVKSVHEIAPKDFKQAMKFVGA